jgi:hypothetical protein
MNKIRTARRLDSHPEIGSGHERQGQRIQLIIEWYK